MKSIFTLLLATAFTSVFARNEGRLTIFIADNNNLKVYVDGRQYAMNSSSLEINSIQNGNHSIEVYRTAKNNGYGNTRGNRNYDRRGALVYSSTVYVRPAYHVDVMINRFGKAMVDEQAIDDRTDRWDNDNYNGNNNGGYNSNMAMSDYDFTQLLARIKNGWFGRLGTTRDAISQNYFNTMQVRQILQQFSAETEKLELAKLAYDRLVDRQNFRQLYDQFSYNAQSDLDRYVRDRR